MVSFDGSEEGAVFCTEVGSTNGSWNLMWGSDVREKSGSTDFDLAWMRVERRLPGMARIGAF